jgi:hypothetical protein
MGKMGEPGMSKEPYRIIGKFFRRKDGQAKVE